MVMNENIEIYITDSKNRLKTIEECFYTINLCYSDMQKKQYAKMHPILYKITQNHSL